MQRDSCGEAVDVLQVRAGERGVDCAEVKDGAWDEEVTC